MAVKHILFVLSEEEFAEKVATFSVEELRAYRDAARRHDEATDNPEARLFYKALACDLSAVIIDRMAREGEELLQRLVQTFPSKSGPS